NHVGEGVCFGIDRGRSVNDLDSFLAFGEREGEVQARVAAGSEYESLLLGSESGDLDCDCVGSKRHGVEMEFAGAVRGSGFSPIGSFSTDDDPATLDGTMLRIVDQDRKSTRLNSSHQIISYAVFCV